MQSGDRAGAPLRIVYLEPVPDDVAAIVRSCLPQGFELHVRRPDETPADAARQADFVLVATTAVTAQLIAAAPRLKLIQHQGVGYDNVDVSAAARAGVPVALTPEGTSASVAEYVILLVLSLYRRLLISTRSLRQGQWLQWELRSGSCDLMGKCLGIVGLGRIGREVAQRARGFECRLLYHDLVRAPASLEESLGVEYAPFDELLAAADVVTLHVPRSEQTRRMIAAPQLARMRPTCLLINTARGGLIDEEALYQALQSGRIAGAGLDVFAVEPPGADHPLLHLDNVVATPHIAAGTRDALAAKMRAAFANMQRVARGEAPCNQVTPLRKESSP